jgi:hypothetical protein
MLQPKTCTALVVALALAAGPLHAQKQDERHHPASASAATPGTMMSGGMPMTGMARMMFGQEGMGGMMAAMTEHVEGRLAFLKTELKITDAQLPLWNAFAEAARGNAKAIEDVMQGGIVGSSQSAALPAKLALREKMMTAHLEALRKLKTAVDPLYAALSNEQRKTADTLVLSPMGTMM